MKKIFLLICVIISLFFSCKKSVKPEITPPPPPPAATAPTITAFTPGSTEVDSTVTITGTNFSATSSNDIVKFNGAVAAVQNATATQLIVTVPADATSGKITVTVGTQTATSATDFILLVISDKWIARKIFPGVIVSANAFAIGDKIYIGGGQIGASVEDFWEYDTKTDDWTQKADYPDGMASDAFGFNIGSKGYFLKENDPTSFWEYDPSSNAWTQKKACPASARGYAIAFGGNSKGYFGLGNTGVNLKDIWEYDPASDSWTQKTDYPGSANVTAASFVIGENAYIGTGRMKSVSLGVSKEFYQYNMTSDTWTKKADFGGDGRTYATGFAINSKGYIGMGRNSANHDIRDFWEYDPSADTWTRKADFPGGAAWDMFGLSTTHGGYAGFGIGLDHMIGPATSSGIYFDLWQYKP